MNYYERHLGDYNFQSGNGWPAGAAIPTGGAARPFSVVGDKEGGDV